MRRLSLIFLLAFVAVSGLSATGFVLTPYTSYSAWATAVQAAGGGTVILTENFNTPGTLSIPGLAYVSTAGSVQCPGPDCDWDDTVGNGKTTVWSFGGYAFPIGWGGLFTVDAGGPGLKFTPIPIPGNGPFEPIILSSGGAADSFFGFVSDSQNAFSGVITESAIANQDQHYTLDDMVYNPEPATCLMLGSGLIGFIWAVRRRQKKA